MPLSPQDVSTKRFTAVRLREGYDMGEVDTFLDEVETELTRLLAENEDLRAKVGAATGRDRPSTPATPEANAKTEETTGEKSDVGTDGVDLVESDATSETGPEAAAPTSGSRAAAVQLPSQQLQVSTIGEASGAAAKLLEIATRNADELVNGAREEADQIVVVARTRAESLEQESKEQADRTETDARNRAQLLDSETADKRTVMLSDLEQAKSRLGAEVEDLRSFEREYRSRLKNYFSEQLEALDGNGEGGSLPEAEAGSDAAPASVDHP